VDRNEIIMRRLFGQHLLSPSDTVTVVQDICGVQAQFLSHALHALKIRSSQLHLVGLIKNWTVRGTMHLFSESDLPLFLHEGRTHHLRAVDTFDTDAYISAKRKQYFAELILNAVANGIVDRDALKQVCENAGMCENESKSLFNPWGGLIRALCESGYLCHEVQEKKAYRLLPSFEPMEELPARLEQARRYFTHFGPATVKDAAYFFGTTQANVKSWLRRLPVFEFVFEGKTYYYIENGSMDRSLPQCIFLAGFDQLLLGYDKYQSVMLPTENVRDIFNLAGIVRPAVLVDGMVVGWWKASNRKLTVNLFTSCDRNMIADSAGAVWTDLKEIEFN